MNRRYLIPGAILACLLQACASPVRTTELHRIDQFSGYRYSTLERQAPKAIDSTAVLVTFSGGGTRAAALADGALRALAETMVRGKDGMAPLSSQIDIVSSVSGGSVTAAYYALGGIGGLDDLERDFLYKDVMGELITKVVLNPFQLFSPRIDILDNYLDEHLFHHKTYRDLLAANHPGNDRRPYVVLNAGDMASGSVFSFNQDQFDLICADLAEFKIADAVSASAAFPVALSALTIKNRAPCEAQRKAAAEDISGWQAENGQPEPKRIVADRSTAESLGVRYPDADNLARFRRGTVALDYLNRDRKEDFIQLLDGGIADNLGLTLPLTLLTSPNESPSFLNWANTGKADKLLLLVVNARGEAGNDFGARASPPGIADMLLTSIATPIDATSFQLLGKLDLLADSRLNPQALVLVDFDLISDNGCRTRFHEMATSWTLAQRDVDDLIALGKAMVLQSPRYKDIVTALGGVVPSANPSVEQICAKTEGR